MQLTTFCPRKIDQIASFCDVISISHLNRTCKRMKSILAARLQMVHHVKDPKLRSGEIGLAIVYRVSDNLPHLIKIRRLEPELCTEKWAAILTTTQKEIGHIEIGWLRIKGNQNQYGYESGKLYRTPYAEKPIKEEIYIKDLEGSKAYSGVGTSLMQAGGMEFGLINGKNCELRVWLNAEYLSHGFYWRLRMRCSTKESNQELAKTLTTLWKKRKKQIEKAYSGRVMRLPAESANEWRLRIRQDPVLYETRSNG